MWSINETLVSTREDENAQPLSNERSKKQSIVTIPFGSRGGFSSSFPRTMHQVFQDARPPDAKALLARVIALEDLEEVQASQASRLTDLERQVFLLQAQRISELEARIAELERSRRKRKPKPSPTENSTGGHHPDEPISS